MKTPAAALTQALKRRARDEGFDTVGVARAERLDRDAEVLRAWLRRDFHATMAWMARAPERRADPTLVLPGCRSVVVAAMGYYPGRGRAATPPGRARVALYARGRDYHRVLGTRLRRLGRWLEEVGGGRCRVYVDTGPVLERAWAERAGVGWIGKNANLLQRDRGSWLLLGEILTTLELEPDPGPHPDFCGTCTACLDACPTGAIVEPGVVDSGRCISYWTIEHRGAIPEGERGSLGEWIFGCDVCQEVCPWNQRFASERSDDAFAWREDLQGLDPVEVLALDEPAFRARFSGTALMRARWDGMRRNAALVLAGRRDRASARALERAAQDADPLVREHAAWALARRRGSG